MKRITQKKLTGVLSHRNTSTMYLKWQKVKPEDYSVMHQNTVNPTIKYILYAFVVLPIFIFRDFTLDNELKYLSIADEALKNGSFFTFTNHGIPYADKPPLYLWIVMLGRVIFGNHNMLFLGIFSFIPALVVLQIMDQWVKNILPQSERLLAQLMLITSCFFMGTALVLRMDMLMCMFIVLSLYIFFKMYSGPTKPILTLLFPFFVFMAIFTKGPVGIIIPFVSITVFLILKREIKSIGKYWGWETLLVIISLCGIWFAGVYSEGGSQYLTDLVFNQTVNRAVNSFHHKEPFYYYLISFLYSLAPWSLLYIGILIVGLKRRLISTNLELFLLVISISTFVILSLFSSKLAVYLLPAFPFLTYLVAIWFSRLGPQRWMLPLIGIPACIFCLALPGAIAAQMLMGPVQLFTVIILLIAALILSFSGVFSIKRLIDNKITRAIATMSIGLLLTIFIVAFTIPKYNSLIGLNELCSRAKKTAVQKGVMNYYYCEMSRAENLDVYLGAKPEMLKMKDLYKAEDAIPIRKPAILFLWQLAIDRNDSLQLFLKNKTKSKIGDYYFVVLE